MSRSTAQSRAGWRNAQNRAEWKAAQEQSIRQIDSIDKSDRRVFKQAPIREGWENVEFNTVDGGSDDPAQRAMKLSAAQSRLRKLLKEKGIDFPRGNTREIMRRYNVITIFAESGQLFLVAPLRSSSLAAHELFKSQLLKEVRDEYPEVEPEFFRVEFDV